MAKSVHVPQGYPPKDPGQTLSSSYEKWNETLTRPGADQRKGGK